MQFSSRHRYAAVLAVISILILVIGVLLKPAPPSHNQREDLTVTRAELENLERVVRRNNLRNLSSTFMTVAEDATSHITMVAPWGVNAVRLPDLEMVVAKRMDTLPRELSTVGEASHQIIEPMQWVPGLPFFTGRLAAGSDVSPANLTNTTPRQGDWVEVVADGVFGQVMMSPGIYNGVVQADCGSFIQYRLLTTVPLNPSHLGGGLFDLVGDLHGVVLPCDDGLAIIPVSELKKAAYAANSDASFTLVMYGMKLVDRPASNSGQSAVVVQEVWDRWPADHAGLSPGDEVIAIDNHPISLVQDIAATLKASGSAPHLVRIRRASRNVELQVSPMSPQVANEARSSLTASDETGVLVDRVTKGSSADRAGLRPQDRIVTLDGRPATPAACEQVFGQLTIQQPVTITIKRPGRRILVQVQP